MSTTGNKTYEVRITPEEVHACIHRFVDDLIDQYPDEAERENVAYSKASVLERQFIRDDLFVRIEGNREVDWLRDNQVRITIKSSLGQFTEKGFIRVQILDAEQKTLWDEWRAT